jgi:peptidoglycan/LPS O-acetylase OafA/YrhL
LAIDSLCRLVLLHAWYPYFNDHPHWLTQGWTLSVEMLFYVAFPFLLKAIEAAKKYVVPIWAVCILLSWLPRMMVMNQSGDPGDQWAQMFPLLRLPEFFVGICSFYIYCQVEKNARLMNLLKYGSMIGLLIVFAQPFQYVRSPWTVGLVLASSLLIIGLSGYTSSAEPSAIRKAFIFLGEASYSLYLIHGFTILMVFKSADKVLKMNSENSLPMFVVCLLVTIFASGFCYRFIEQPARQWIRKISFRAAPISP